MMTTPEKLNHIDCSSGDKDSAAVLKILLHPTLSLTCIISSSVCTWRLFHHLEWTSYSENVYETLLGPIFYLSMILSIIMSLGAIAGTPKRLQSDHWWHVREESLVFFLITIIGTWALALVMSFQEGYIASSAFGLIAILQGCLAAYVCH